VIKMTDEEFSPTTQTDATIDVMQNTLDEFVATADVSAVYGEPLERGDTTIIPTAEVLCGLGFGVGYGGGKSQEEGEEKQSEGSGFGGGGGGRVLSRPVAVIIASPDGVRIEPVVDVTKIALAALTAAGFMVGMLLRMSSPRRFLRETED
jgi:uncharacterized spore protein YtfJ